MSRAVHGGPPSADRAARNAPRLLIATPDMPPARGGIQLLMGRLSEHLSAFDAEIVTFRQPGLRSRSGPHRVRGTVPRPRRGHKLAVVALNAHTVLRGLLRRPQLVVCGYVTLAPACRLLTALLRIPYVQYAHADEFRVRPRASAAAVRHAALTIAVSAHTRDLALDAGADPSRLVVIHPGVDVPESWSADRPAGPPTVVTVARLDVPHKGHDVIVEALGEIASDVPDVRWVVVGAGDPERLRATVRAAGHEDRVEWCVDATDAERDARLERAHVFLLPSRVPEGGGGEGFGIAYLEASARGLPVVGAEHGGPADAIRHERTGLCVDTDSVAAVAAATSSLLRDPARARELGTGGRAWAEEHRWPTIARRVEASLLAVRAGASR